MDKVAQPPLLIVITPIRNEAWVLDAFLTCTSSWADYIILADQHSTDGTREIAQKYPKVRLIDNPTEEWYEMICRARLLEEAQSIPGDKIIFGMDADEFLSEGFEKTEDWQQIIHSKPNTIFCLHWRNLYDDFHHDQDDHHIAEWIAHYGADVDVVEEYKKREIHAVHSSRVPCLDEKDAKYVVLEDIHFVHLAKLNKIRTQNKLDFYQVTWLDKNPDQIGFVNVSREYNDYYPSEGVQYSESPIRLACKGSTKDYASLVKTADYGSHYIEEITKVIAKKGFEKFKWLNIWQNPYLQTIVDKAHYPFYVRIVHFYLNKTQPYRHHKLIKGMDKLINFILKKVYYHQ